MNQFYAGKREDIHR